MKNLTPHPLTADAFAMFGDVLELKAEPDIVINEGMCGRHHNLARLDIVDGAAGISLFDANLRSYPHAVKLVERHPLGSQAFIPMSETGFLVVVAEDNDGTPENLRAFLTKPGQGINFHRGIWHGVLAPLTAPGLFAVVDRIGEGKNLEEFWFDDPFTVIEPA
jgi:ureidoglycolate lyase